MSQSPDDTLKVNARLINPENHTASVFAVIQGDQSNYIDSLQLFDDGLHGDADSSDNMWGNIKMTTGLHREKPDQLLQYPDNHCYQYLKQLYHGHHPCLKR